MIKLWGEIFFLIKVQTKLEADKSAEQLSDTNPQVIITLGRNILVILNFIEKPPSLFNKKTYFQHFKLSFASHMVAFPTWHKALKRADIPLPLVQVVEKVGGSTMKVFVDDEDSSQYCH